MFAASAIGPWPNTIQMALRKLTSRLNLNMHTIYLTQLMKMKLPLTKNSPWVHPLHLACKRLKMRRDRTLRVPINGLICIKPRSILRWQKCPMMAKLSSIAHSSLTSGWINKLRGLNTFSMIQNPNCILSQAPMNSGSLRGAKHSVMNAVNSQSNIGRKMMLMKPTIFLIGQWSSLSALASLWCLSPSSTLSGELSCSAANAATIGSVAIVIVLKELVTKVTTISPTKMAIETTITMKETAIVTVKITEMLKLLITTNHWQSSALVVANKSWKMSLRMALMTLSSSKTDLSSSYVDS